MKTLLRKAILAIFLLLFCTTFVNGEVYYVDTDAYGTPVAVSTSDGTTVWESDYYPFGELYRNINNQKPNNRGLIGKEKDQETGLTYFGARYYDEALARFGSVDPIGPVDPWTSQTDYAYLTNPQRLNRYVYGMNNPYRYVDPDGRESVGQLGIGNPGSYGGTNTIGSMADDDRDSIESDPFIDITSILGLAKVSISFLKGGVIALKGTPGGRTLTDHALERMTNPPKGRAPMTPLEVDEVLDTANRIKKVSAHPKGDTITVQNTTMPGKPQVVVDAETGKRVITVIKNKPK